MPFQVRVGNEAVDFPRQPVQEVELFAADRHFAQPRRTEPECPAVRLELDVPARAEEVAQVVDADLVGVTEDAGERQREAR